MSSTTTRRSESDTYQPQNRSRVSPMVYLRTSQARRRHALVPWRTPGSSLPAKPEAKVKPERRLSAYKAEAKQLAFLGMPGRVCDRRQRCHLSVSFQELQEARASLVWACSGTEVTITLCIYTVSHSGYLFSSSSNSHFHRSVILSALHLLFIGFDSLYFCLSSNV